MRKEWLLLDQIRGNSSRVHTKQRIKSIRRKGILTIPYLNLINKAKGEEEEEEQNEIHRQRYSSDIILNNHNYVVPGSFLPFSAPGLSLSLSGLCSK